MEQFLVANQWVILLIIAWTIFWKGIALWKAARNTHKRWFIALLLLNTLALLEIIYIFIFGRKKQLREQV
ncbi:MAG: hypothetical protein CO031_02780 [Candidatus Nealsonbacteria bacterium CG_4_9_14_0_2_um_filter_37_38]|uniref:DUF5652 domain-containing protein n=1 Tax=Candidatus Nealsonbacteria bacterium CG_4_10_14_0_8_um_filter_37_14 TaxID=1974684 RepID=A0A2M7R566_9BACT|nr:MAG: hypothetical protein COV63_03505 [Candidatus Nealsonbacteria bacterium CG11_big_fil_rev_8_21_14_0_20_37_68]PIW91842.1 MAG: hypothetical protein COZ89_02980 [Candidatus Nealsonbacteria bacterium CG_4_8_14_3_um_filter_37_23]PIY88401.1 MAG: hypothetical protein COY73_03955 [Candidatus Nealsonbacteria bacterium CG_4_10_14_0_8_um_filter_37_14]PJC51414.1 MAG: hypothetical protein CO031_02780 [Candidatus Nealsonbacteria bacterium CG_4_9_14_0_2_um_filter_37_38]